MEGVIEADDAREATGDAPPDAPEGAFRQAPDAPAGAPTEAPAAPADAPPVPPRQPGAPYLRVLGTVAVILPDGTEVPLSRSQRIICARLVLAAPQPVHWLDLADAVWGDDRPASARAAIQNQISRIRSAVIHDVIATAGDGYVLRLPTDVSLLQAAARTAQEALVPSPDWPGVADTPTSPTERGDGPLPGAEGGEGAGLAPGPDTRVRDAVDTLERLLVDDQPEVFADLDRSDAVLAYRSHAAAVVAAARTVRLGAAVATGRWAWALIEGARLHAAAPLDEQIAAGYARALALAGRRSQALAVIAEIRRALRIQLGVDAGDHLDAAERDVLHGRAAAPHRDRRAPDRGAPLIGRRSELRRIMQAVAQRHPVLVRGEHGAGVSRILFELRTRLRSLGVRVVLVRADEHPHSATSLVEELLAELGAAKDPTLNAISALTAAVATIDDDHPTVLIIDDVHFLGPSTWQALLGVAESPHGGLVLGGHGMMPGVGDKVEVVLEALGAEEVAALARSWGIDRDSTIGRITEAAGGNPLAVRLLVQMVRQRPPGPAGSAAGMDTGPITEFLQHLVGELDADRRHDLQLAAIAGDGYPIAALERVPWAYPPQPPAELVEIDAEGQLRFRHGAVQPFVYRTLARGALLDMHYALGLAAREIGAPAGTVARHLLAAAELDPDEAIEAARQAAREASLLGAHADAADWLAQARRVLGGDLEVLRNYVPGGLLARRPGDDAAMPVPGGAQAAGAGGPAGGEAAGGSAGGDAAAVDGSAPLRDARGIALAVEYADALRLAGDARHLPELTAAAEAALAFGDETLIAAAGFALLQLGASSPVGEPDNAVVSLAGRVLDAITDPELRAPVQAAASLAWSMTGQPDRARALFDAAEAAARHPATRLAVLPFAYLAVGRPGELDRRDALSRELVDTARAAGAPVPLWEGLHQRFTVHLQRGEGAAMRAALVELTALTESIGDVGRRWSALYCAATVAEIDGEFARCETLASQALSIFGKVSPERAGAAYFGQLLPLYLRQGRLAELRPSIMAMVVQQPAVTAWHAAAGLVLADELVASAGAPGRSDDGPRADVARHLTITLDRTQDDFTYLAAQLIGGRAAALLGEIPLAQRYFERLELWQHLVCWQGTCSYGPVAAVLAPLADLLGDSAAAAHYTARADALTVSLAARP